MLSLYFKHKRLALILLCVLILNILSLVFIYSSISAQEKFKEKKIFYKQIIWVILGWCVFFIFSFINYRFYFDWAFLLYFLNFIFLFLVFLFGRKVMGAQRWLDLGLFNFQPSEFSKFVILVVLSRLFINKKDYLKTVFFSLCLVAFNFLFIFHQPDLGTAFILIIIYFFLGFISKIPKRFFIFFIIILLLFLPFFWTQLKPYQKNRLLVFINPEKDPLGAGYTIIQSKIAIGSGGFLGKGFLAGTQNKFNFLPERHTDFIFSLIAEEIGFLGSLFLIFLYFIILKNIIQIAIDKKDEFAELLLLGISSLFFVQIFINLSMTLGLLPVVGIPLLFISYGGTHLLISFLLLGIITNIYFYA